MGTTRFEYNRHNPVGFALVIITIVFVGGMLLLMHNHPGPFTYPSDPTPTPISTATDDISRYAPPGSEPSDDGIIGPVPSMPPDDDSWTP